MSSTLWPQAATRGQRRRHGGRQSLPEKGKYTPGQERLSRTYPTGAQSIVGYREEWISITLSAGIHAFTGLVGPLALVSPAAWSNCPAGSRLYIGDYPRSVARVRDARGTRAALSPPHDLPCANTIIGITGTSEETDITGYLRDRGAITSAAHYSHPLLLWHNKLRVWLRSIDHLSENQMPQAATAIRVPGEPVLATADTRS